MDFTDKADDSGISEISVACRPHGNSYRFEVDEGAEDATLFYELVKGLP